VLKIATFGKLQNVIHKARKENNFGKQIGGSLIDTLTDHAKRKFCFFACALKKKKNASTHFSTFTCSHQPTHHHRK
jgi:hypothetical protein